MADFYTRQRSNALRLITLRGRTVQIRRKVTYGDSWDPQSTNDDTPVKAIVGDATQDEIDGTNVQVGDKRFTFVSDLTVTTEDLIVDGSTVYFIGKVREAKPGDTSIVQVAWGRS